MELRKLKKKKQLIDSNRYQLFTKIHSNLKLFFSCTFHRENIAVVIRLCTMHMCVREMCVLRVPLDCCCESHRGQVSSRQSLSLTVTPRD